MMSGPNDDQQQNQFDDGCGLDFGDSMSRIQDSDAPEPLVSELPCHEIQNTMTMNLTPDLCSPVLDLDDLRVSNNLQKTWKYIRGSETSFDSVWEKIDQLIQNRKNNRLDQVSDNYSSPRRHDIPPLNSNTVCISSQDLPSVSESSHKLPSMEVATYELPSVDINSPDASTQDQTFQNSCPPQETDAFHLHKVSCDYTSFLNLATNYVRTEDGVVEWMIILPTPFDGWCIMHSVVGSYNSQLQPNELLDVHDLARMLFIHLARNIDRYIVSTEYQTAYNYVQALQKYFALKRFDEDIVDLIPMALSEILNINIRIKDENGSYMNTADNQEWEIVYVFRSEAHYSYLAPVAE